ncbi:gamma-aminobutyric acid receptor subunit rho-2-like isoform X2 [Symsagittifera roscoffensis]
MQMSVDIYFRQYWTDGRLIGLYEHVANSTSAIPGQEVQLGYDHIEQLWFPDMYWVDALEVWKPGVLARSQLLELQSDGSIFFSSRLLLTFRCEMDLKYFPFDVQECHLCFESYYYHTEHQNMSWVNKEISFTPNQKIANFYIESAPVTYTKETTYNLGTTWKQLCLKMSFPRKLAIYAVTMFLPSIALVILSWVGFWVDKEAVPARSGLSITSILAQITLINGTGNSFPGVADVKMGDLYLIVNFFYVFLTLVEFAIVSYQPPARARWKRARELMLPGSSGKAKVEPKKESVPKSLPDNIQKENETKQSVIDALYAMCVQANGAAPSTDNTNTQEASNLPKVFGSNGSSLNNSEVSLPRFDYWSAANADEICKWLFPSSFLLWNLLYFSIMYNVSGRW